MAKKKQGAKTTKVVVNSCHGGFGLSDKAYERLIELGVPVTSEPNSKKRSIYKNETSTELLGEYHDIWFNQHRDDKLLIKVVEELINRDGVDHASGKYAELRIVEVPADVNWYIEEYDGAEWVAEEHRTWGN